MFDRTSKHRSHSLFVCSFGTNRIDSRTKKCWRIFRNRHLIDQLMEWDKQWSKRIVHIYCPNKIPIDWNDHRDDRWAFSQVWRMIAVLKRMTSIVSCSPSNDVFLGRNSLECFVIVFCFSQKWTVRGSDGARSNHWKRNWSYFSDFFCWRGSTMNKEFNVLFLSSIHSSVNQCVRGKILRSPTDIGTSIIRSHEINHRIVLRDIENVSDFCHKSLSMVVIGWRVRHLLRHLELVVVGEDPLRTKSIVLIQLNWSERNIFGRDDKALPILFDFFSDRPVHSADLSLLEIRTHLKTQSNAIDDQSMIFVQWDNKMKIDCVCWRRAKDLFSGKWSPDCLVNSRWRKIITLRLMRRIQWAFQSGICQSSNALSHIHRFKVSRREFLFSLVESALINHSLFFHRLRWTREMKRDEQGFLHWAMSEVFNRFVWQWTDQIERQLISSENPRTSKKKRQVLMIFFFTDWRRSTRELFFSRLSSQASLFWERMCEGG